jgi:hypothetical protein
MELDCVQNGTEIRVLDHRRDDFRLKPGPLDSTVRTTGQRKDGSDEELFESLDIRAGTCE